MTPGLVTGERPGDMHTHKTALCVCVCVGKSLTLNWKMWHIQNAKGLWYNFNPPIYKMGVGGSTWTIGTELVEQLRWSPS